MKCFRNYKGNIEKTFTYEGNLHVVTVEFKIPGLIKEVNIGAKLVVDGAKKHIEGPLNETQLKKLKEKSQKKILESDVDYDDALSYADEDEEEDGLSYASDENSELSSVSSNENKYFPVNPQRKKHKSDSITQDQQEKTEEGENRGIFNYFSEKKSEKFFEENFKELENNKEKKKTQLNKEIDKVLDDWQMSEIKKERQQITLDGNFKTIQSAFYLGAEIMNFDIGKKYKPQEEPPHENYSSHRKNPQYLAPFHHQAKPQSFPFQASPYGQQYHQSPNWYGFHGSPNHQQQQQKYQNYGGEINHNYDQRMKNGNGYGEKNPRHMGYQQERSQLQNYGYDEYGRQYYQQESSYGHYGEEGYGYPENSQSYEYQEQGRKKNFSIPIEESETTQSGKKSARSYYNVKSDSFLPQSEIDSNSGFGSVVEGDSAANRRVNMPENRNRGRQEPRVNKTVNKKNPRQKTDENSKIRNFKGKKLLTRIKPLNFSTKDLLRIQAKVGPLIKAKWVKLTQIKDSLRLQKNKNSIETLKISNKMHDIQHKHKGFQNYNNNEGRRQPQPKQRHHNNDKRGFRSGRDRRQQEDEGNWNRRRRGNQGHRGRGRGRGRGGRRFYYEEKKGGRY